MSEDRKPTDVAWTHQTPWGTLTGLYNGTSTLKAEGTPARKFPLKRKYRG